MLDRYNLSQDEDFQGRVMIATAQLAHKILNIKPEQAANEATTQALWLLQAKAQEYINNPEGFHKKLAVSTAALMPDTEDHIEIMIQDETLAEVLLDVFDGFAGVGAHLGEAQWTLVLEDSNGRN